MVVIATEIYNNNCSVICLSIMDKHIMEEHLQISVASNLELI